MEGNNPKVGLVSIDACAKFYEILSIGTQDIERKHKKENIAEWRTTQIQYSPRFFKAGL